MGDVAGQAPTIQQAADTPVVQPITPSAPVDSEPKTFDATYVHQLREEAAANRKKANEAEAKLKAIEDAKLTEQERAAKRLAELEPQAARAAEYETAVAEMLTARLAGLTPEAKKAVESLPAQDALSRMRWLTANEALFTRQPAPRLDGGTGSGTRPNTLTLTAEQEATARKMGIPLDKYAARLAELKAANKE